MNADRPAWSPPPGYTFARAPHQREQLSILQEYLDPITTGVLGELHLPDQARCLDLGAGGGSVTRWLASRVAPTGGEVVAVDLDTGPLRGLDGAPGVRVRCHDLVNGPPPGGPWDLIHARLLLLHLPQRQRLLRQLVHTLAPGGWLVLGEFSDHPLTVLTAAHDTDAVLFTRVLDGLRTVLADHGADLGWAHRVHRELTELELSDVHTVEHAESWTGGDQATRLHHVNSVQKQDALQRLGFTTDELDRFRRLLTDPRFSARSWQFVCTRARRPSAVGPPRRLDALTDDVRGVRAGGDREGAAGPLLPQRRGAPGSIRSVAALAAAAITLAACGSPSTPVSEPSPTPATTPADTAAAVTTPTPVTTPEREWTAAQQQIIDQVLEVYHEFREVEDELSVRPHPTSEVGEKLRHTLTGGLHGLMWWELTEMYEHGIGRPGPLTTEVQVVDVHTESTPHLVTLRECVDMTDAPLIYLDTGELVGEDLPEELLGMPSAPGRYVRTLQGADFGDGWWLLEDGGWELDDTC